jgi:hypothetical protein
MCRRRERGAVLCGGVMVGERTKVLFVKLDWVCF